MKKPHPHKPVIIIVQTPGATPPAAPTVNVAASISGDTAPGATLTGTPATFVGTGVVVVNSFQKNGGSWVVGLTYSDTVEGDSIMFRSVGTNGGGSVTSTSAAFVVEAAEESEGAFLDLAWANGSGLPGLLGFKLNESADGETGWTVAKTFADPDAISGELANLDYNQLRYFYLSAYTASLDSAVIGVIGRYTIPPHVPANPQAVADGYFAINLSIDAPAEEPVGGVHVWRDAGSGYELNDTWPPGVHSGVDDSLVSGASYSYKFSAFNQNPDATFAETAFSTVATESTVAFDYIYASDLTTGAEYSGDWTTYSGSPVFADGSINVNGGEIGLIFADLSEAAVDTCCLFMRIEPTPPNSWVIGFFDGPTLATMGEDSITLGGDATGSQALPTNTLTSYAARYVWITYVRNTSFQVLVSTSQTKPTPDATNSCTYTGAAVTDAINLIYFQGTVVISKIRVANTALGSYPV